MDKCTKKCPMDILGTIKTYFKWGKRYENNKYKRNSTRNKGCNKKNNTIRC